MIVINKSIEIIKGKIYSTQNITIGRLYWYANDIPPKNVHDSYFFNVDDVIFSIFSCYRS